MIDELTWLDATETAERIRRGEVSAREVIDAAIARIEALDPTLNAVIHRRFGRARDEASGVGAGSEAPFAGVPFLLKDAVCHSAGDPFHAGCRALKNANYVSPTDTYLATRFRQAGFVLLGRTNVPEFATSATTEPLAYGATHNPWALDRSPGGSSGGSAAAVAAGLVPVAHGNDMGGSIRIPAAFTGLVGLKPSRARITIGPDHGEYWAQLTHEFVLTRSVRDCAAVLDAVHGAAPGDPYIAPPPVRPYLTEVGAAVRPLRIAMRTARLDGRVTDPDIATAVEGVGATLNLIGHHVAADPLTELEGDGPRVAMGIVVAAWIARELDQWEARLGRAIGDDELEPMTTYMRERGRAMRAVDYIAGQQAMQAYARKASRWTERADLLLLPTSPVHAPRLGVLAPYPTIVDPDVDPASPAHFTVPFDITGEPAISLPLAWSASGMPIGVQLVAPYGREDLLLAIAAQLELACPWAHRRPPHAAG
jgi:amidase